MTNLPNYNIGKSIAKNLTSTFAISSLVTFILVIIIYNPNTSGNHGSGMLMILVFVSLLWTFCFSLASLTTFLNINKTIRENTLYRILSFLLLHLSC